MERRLLPCIVLDTARWNALQIKHSDLGCAIIRVKRLKVNVPVRADGGEEEIRIFSRDPERSGSMAGVEHSRKLIGRWKGREAMDALTWAYTGTAIVITVYSD